jgi:hypothetical protein
LRLATRPATISALDVSGQNRTDRTMQNDTPVAVIGAGPYGLSAAAHLRRAGVEVRVFGDPMAFWRTMPKGMLLRSNWSATCIAEYRGPLSLDSYQAATGASFGRPVPLERFVEYGMWVQAQAAPDVDRRMVRRLERDGERFRLTLDDETVHAHRVVVACGIADFMWRPPAFAELPPHLVSHTGEHDDLSVFAGQRVLVVGGGQSALEAAALITGSGGDVEVVVRRDHVNWLHGGKYHRMLGRAAPLVYAPTDVGPMGLSRVVAVPDLFRRFPRRLQEPMARRSIRAAGAAWLVPRLEGVPIRLSERVVNAEPRGEGLHVRLGGGGTTDVSHLLLGTGYRVDLDRYAFLAPELARSVERANGYPVLGPGLESSVPGLHFMGAAAAWSFGPIMRFVSGSWYGGKALVDAVGRRGRAPNGEPAVRGDS